MTAPLLMFTPADLRLLRYLVAVARQCIPPNHASAPHAATRFARVDAELAVSRRRSESDCATPHLENGDYVGTAEAARLLGCSQRRVQQRIAAGELTAVLVGRTYCVNRRDI